MTIRGTAFWLPRGECLPPDWLAVNAVLALFGSRKAVAIRTYDCFVAKGLTAPSPWSALSGQIYLGSERFLERMQKRVSAQLAKDVARAQLQPTRPSADAVLADVARKYGLSRAQVLDRSQAQAFKLAVYRLHREANLTIKEVASLAGVSLPRVSQIQAEMERR